MLLEILRDYIWSDELKVQGRMSARDFVRNRVLTFPALVLFFINSAKKSLHVSLHQFCAVFNWLPITKQAFSKARMKLSAQTFVLLNRKLVEEFYSDNNYLSWKGFRLIAVDGSDIQIPQKEELKMGFGTIKNQRGATLAMAKISYAYDVLNKITLDAQIDRCKTSERDLAVRHVEAIQKPICDSSKDLYIFDRGYPSLGLMFYMSNKKKDFLIRCAPSSCPSKVKQAFDGGEEDVIVRLYACEASDEQIADLKKRVPSLDRKTAYIDVRLVVEYLSTGEKELLITTLLDQKLYQKKEIKGLYGLRWGVEENYKWHKVALELENFSGHSRTAIEQDLFSLILTANIASLLMQEAQDELIEEHKEKALKHTYSINKRIAIATLKDRLVSGIFDPDFDLDALCNELKTEFKKSLCPVRPDRKYERPKKGRLKYGCTMRKCI